MGFIFDGWVSFLEVTVSWINGWVSFLVVWVAGFHCSLVRWLWFLWVGGGSFGCVDGGGWMRVLILVGLMVVVVGWVGLGSAWWWWQWAVWVIYWVV